VIVPACKEEDCIDELVRRITIVFDSITTYDFEAVIVENGSTDSTFELLKQASAADPRSRIVRLSRNFRMDGGITVGWIKFPGTQRLSGRLIFKTPRS